MKDLPKDGLDFRIHTVLSSDLAATALSSLQKKNADMNYVSKLCAAADRESEGSMKSGTKQIAQRKTERRFHQFFGRSCPKVRQISVPLVRCKKTKKVEQQSCSAEADLGFINVFVLPSCSAWHMYVCFVCYRLMKVSSSRVTTWVGWRSAPGSCEIFVLVSLRPETVKCITA